LLARAEGRVDQPVEDALIEALSQRITAHDASADPAKASELAALLALPGLPELEALQSPVDPVALFEAAQSWCRELGQRLRPDLLTLLAQTRGDWPKAWPEGQGGRQLTALAWRWLVASKDAEACQEACSAVSGPSMTLARAALRALLPVDVLEREQALGLFYERWKDKPVILDAWFGLEASTPRRDGLQRVSQLLEHPRFDPLAPNSLRAVLGGLTANVPVFHAVDGSGYRFMAEQIAAVDARNPITASRLAKVFSRWRSYAPERQRAMREAIDQLASRSLSSNTAEVVTMLRP